MSEKKYSHQLKCVAECGETIVLRYNENETVETACPKCGRKVKGYAIGDKMGTVVIQWRKGG